MVGAPAGPVTPSWHGEGMDATPTPSDMSDPSPGDPRLPTATGYVIDCEQCVMQHTEACGDCVVSFLCSREPGDAVVVDVNEYRALRMLADSGLAPSLRHRRRSG